MRRPTKLVATLVATAFALIACSKTEPAPEPVRAVGPSSSNRPARVAVSSMPARSGRARVAPELSRRRQDDRAQRRSRRRVKAGQVLAQLDPQDLRLGQDAARRRRRGGATRTCSRPQPTSSAIKDLRDQGFISCAELERRDTTLKSAQAQLDQAQAQSSVQGNQAAYAALVADASGVVTGVDVEPGMVVAAGDAGAAPGPRRPARRRLLGARGQGRRLIQALAARGGSCRGAAVGGGGATLARDVREVAASADPMTRTFLVKADLSAPTCRRCASARPRRCRSRAAGARASTKLPLSALREEQGRTTVWLVDRRR